jgi:Cu/Ag efflux pump CusA
MACRSWSRTSAAWRSASRRGSASSASKKQDDAVEGVILLRTGEKTQDVLRGVEAKTKELNDEILPKDVKVIRSTTAATWFRSPPRS